MAVSVAAWLELRAARLQNLQRYNMRTKNLVKILLLCLIAAGVGCGEGFAANTGPEADSAFRLIGKWTIQQKNSSGNTFRGAWVITQRGAEIAGTAAE